MIKKVIIVLFFLILAMPAHAYYNPGAPVGFINDFVGVINEQDKETLENKLQTFEKDSGNEIAVVIIPSLKGDYIEHFAIKLFQDWGIGKKDVNNGVLLLVAIDDRQMRIEVGYGLEGALTDAQSSWIINNELKPAFQKGDYSAGINNAVDQIINATKGEYVPEEDGSQIYNIQNLKVIFGIFIFIFMWLSSILARSKSWWAGGLIGAVAGIIIAFIWGFVWIGTLSIIFFSLIGLVFDYIVSKQYQKARTSGHHMPWWIGGGGHGGSSGGFGGFGGGFSGGGGSSGSW